MFILSSHSLYGWPVADVFGFAKKLGFDGLEIVITSDRDTFDPNRLNSLSQEHNLPVYSIHSPLSASMPGWEMDSVERVKRSVFVAEKVNARIVVIHPPARFVVPTARNIINGSLFYGFLSGCRDYTRWFVQELENFSNSTAVTVAVENMPCERLCGLSVYPGEYYKPSQLKLLKHLTLDVTHLGACGLDVLETYKELKDMVTHIHLSNYNGREHRLLDDGLLPLKELLGELKRDNYQNAVTLEFLPEVVGAHNYNTAFKNLEKSLSFCRKAFI